MRLVALHGGTPVDVQVERYGSGYRVTLDDRAFVVDLVSLGASVHSLRFEDGTQFSLIHHSDGDDHEVAIGGSKVRLQIVDPLSLRRTARDDERGAGGTVRALMPGRIVRVMVSKGEAVRKGSALLILEAMKMENEIQAPGDGVIDEIHVESGQTVEAGAPLLHISSK